MNGKDIAARCDYFEMVHGVTLRAIRLFGDAELEFRATAGVRTPRELGLHMYSQEQILAEAARSGGFDDEHWHHRGQRYTYLRLLGESPRISTTTAPASEPI